MCPKQSPSLRPNIPYRSSVRRRVIGDPYDFSPKETVFDVYLGVNSTHEGKETRRIRGSKRQSERRYERNQWQNERTDERTSKQKNDKDDRNESNDRKREKSGNGEREGEEWSTCNKMEREEKRGERERERVVRGRRSGSTGGFGAAWRARGGNSTRGGGLEWFSCSGTAAQVARVSPFSRRSRSRVGVRACIIRSVLLAPLLASRRSLPRGVIRGFSRHVPLVTRVCRVTSDQARGSSTRALRTSSVQSSLSPNRNHRHFDGDAEFFKCDLITTQSTKRNRG